MHRSIPLQSLSVVLTSDCNLRCAYCYQAAKSSRAMAWADLRRALEFVASSSFPLVRLLFSGGEPLLAFDLLRRAVRHVEAFGPRRPRVRYEVCTNGLLLGRPEARFLDQRDFGVRLSFDGVERTQRLRGPGTFAVLEGLLSRLRREQSSGFLNRLQVGMTVVPETVACLAESVDYFLGQGIKDIEFEPAVLPGTEPDEGLPRELDRQFARIFASSVRHYERTGHVAVRAFRKRGEPAAAPGSARLCEVGSPYSFAVDVDGSVCGCLPLARSYQRFPATDLGRQVAALPAGHVAVPPSRAWFSRYRAAVERIPAFVRRRSKWSSYGRCSTCRYLAQCHICPMSIVLSAGARSSPHRVPDFLCAFNRVRAKYWRRFPSPQS